MKHTETFEIRGTKDNPYHLSVGAVLSDNGGRIAVIRKRNNYYCLPRETIYTNETLIHGLQRGLKEEVGVRASAGRYLGSLVSPISLPDGTEIEKTTLYFEARVTCFLGKREPEDDERSDEVLWLAPSEAVNLVGNSFGGGLEGGKNAEDVIIARSSRFSAPAAG